MDKRLFFTSLLMSGLFLIGCAGEESSPSKDESPVEADSSHTSNEEIEETKEEVELNQDSIYYNQLDHFSTAPDVNGELPMGLIIRGPENIYYASLDSMFDQCQDGDSLFIRAGNHELERTLELWEKNDIVVTGERNTKLIAQNIDENVIWVITCNNIHLRNLHATHVEPPIDRSCVGNVFATDMGENITIESCDINGCGAVGVYVFGTKKVILKDNYIHDNTLWAIDDNGNGMIEEEESEDIIFINNRYDNNGYKNENPIDDHHFYGDH
jgi:parallel beta-helix repeat protein